MFSPYKAIPTVSDRMCLGLVHPSNPLAYILPRVADALIDFEELLGPVRQITLLEDVLSPILTHQVTGRDWLLSRVKLLGIRSPPDS